jgi:hypothetical protein
MSDIKTQIESWIATDAQPTINSYYSEHLTSLTAPELTVSYGRKYARIMKESCCWAFIALSNDPSKAIVIGDLLKPASYKTPAKHSRGNILNTTAVYDSYGPAYLK